MNGRRWAGAIAGGVAAGAALSALLLVQEHRSGGPPSPREQVMIRRGHLALSALAGAAYAAATPDEASLIPSGAGFGLAFHISAHWIAGPLLGVERPERRSGVEIIAPHTADHIIFALAVVAAASAASRHKEPQT